MTVARPTVVGVLALQGDFAAHEKALGSAAARLEDRFEVRLVRRPDQLDGLAGVVLPGGESTTFLKLLRHQGLDVALPEFHARGGVLFGTCAGAIVLAREVVNPSQPSLGLLDASVERNAYGRQVDSFVGAAKVEAAGVKALGQTLEAVFIRAPRFRAIGSEVEILATLDDAPVLVRQGRILAATFHPELAADSPVHDVFLDACIAASAETGGFGPASAETDGFRLASAETDDRYPASAAADDRHPASAETDDRHPASAETDDRHPASAETDDRRATTVEIAPKP